jgi:hypothetical protein
MFELQPINTDNYEIQPVIFKIDKVKHIDPLLIKVFGGFRHVSGSSISARQDVQPGEFQ